MTENSGQWHEARERSNVLALKFLVFFALTLGRRLVRLVLHPIALYFMVFSRGVSGHSKRYLSRALQREPGWFDVYRHIYTFAAVTLDRIWFVRGQVNHFQVNALGWESLLQCLSEGKGAYLLGAHFGSFEALRSVGLTGYGDRVAMVMYPENAKMVNRILSALSPDVRFQVIPIGQAGSTLAIRDWLDDGGLVGLLGDRHLHTDKSAKEADKRLGVVSLPFLGRDALFSDGPLKLAMLLRRRVFFMVGIYRGGNRYEVRFEELADFRQLPNDPAQRTVLLRDALAAYVARLEGLCYSHPFNWFNFYDYWCEGESPAVSD
jgi:predicted LPLAT superfamily acyltransferase